MGGREVDSSDITAAKRRGYIALKFESIAVEQVDRSFVERVVRVGFQKEELEAVQNGGQSEDGLPILSQDIQTDVSVKIHVGMIDAGIAFDFWRFVRVVVGNSDAEGK